MKSFFNFLRNNKAYTLIDVIGLSISFMFVILIGAYAWQETHIDHWQSKADRIYALGFKMPSGNIYTCHHWAMQQRLRDAFPEIESSTAVMMTEAGFHIGEKDVMTNVMAVDSTFLNIFDFDLVVGDRATALADKHSVIVTERWAQGHFGDEDPIGKRFSWQADSVYLVISGIMSEPKQTMFLTQNHQYPDVIMRIEMENYAGVTWIFDPGMDQIGSNDVYLLAADGVDLSDKLDVYQEFMRSNFQVFRNLGKEDEWALKIFPLKSIYAQGIASTSGNHIEGNMSVVKILFAVGSVVLLFALLNYVNLTVALATKRAKEMATRRLLGSSRASIVWRLIGESALLCALSMAIGIGLAFLVEPYCDSLVDLHVDIEPCITASTVAIAMGIYALMSVAAGIIPAIMISDNKPIDIVRGSFRRQTKMVYSKLIIVVQNIITIAMIVCSLGMLLQVRHLVNAPLGYDTANKIMVRNPGIGEWRMKIIHDELQKLPCVKRVSNVWGSPLSGGMYNEWEVDGKKVRAQTMQGDSTFFDMWNVEVLRDNHVNGAGWWVTPALLASLGLDEDAVSFTYHDRTDMVAGVIKDFHTGNILDTQSTNKMITIHPITNPWTIFVEYTGDPSEALTRVREVYDGVSPVPMDQDTYFVDDYIAKQFQNERNVSVIMTIFAIVAIIISLLGLLAISTYYVQQREREIAVRKVFGSTASGIIGRVTRSFVVYVIISFALAVPIAYMVLSDWLSQYSYRIPVYWWLFALAFALTIGITALTVYAQSRQAANSNPINALNHN